MKSLLYVSDNEVEKAGDKDLESSGLHEEDEEQQNKGIEAVECSKKDRVIKNHFL